MGSDSSWLVHMEVMLGSLDHIEVQSCSICRVSDELRGLKEKAYKPKCISIGPLHRGATSYLELMEESKWQYMREFLERQGIIREQNRTSEVRLNECGNDIVKLVEIIRASYGGSIFDSESPQEIAKIMILDGCFLLEFLTRLGNYKLSYDDPIFETKEKVLSIVNDITMLENQIPFIVLKKLYRKVFPDGSEIEDDHRVANIVRKAFDYPLVNATGGAHILHLIHLSTVDQSKREEGKRANQQLFRCASRLRAAGIIICPKKQNISNNQQQHTLADTFDFDINFNIESGKLEIPVLYVKETTEVRWRNLIAWEQSRIGVKCKYTSYALFFKELICCKHDIELLEEKGVIVVLNKCVKSKELLTLFRTISKGAEHMDSSYSEICDRLNVYKGEKATKAFGLRLIVWHQCKRIFEVVLYYCQNWYKILRRDHIPTVWKFIGVVAAILLLVLTIMQTYYSARG
ncbi:UPF0481 protein At3g47200-like [Trifolium pratense]|uniref:UPF0481 protein At3g47200-like n=1 Tax=Trifolium pratense TaxID=57577 RepID=UPI001E69133A|nr:UPF0481 protein At3g47200-like [Trifolium pratense]